MCMCACACMCVCLSVCVYVSQRVKKWLMQLWKMSSPKSAEQADMLETQERVDVVVASPNSVCWQNPSSLADLPPGLPGWC